MLTQPWKRSELPVVLLQLGVQVHLQFLQAAVQLLAEEHAVAFILQSLVEPFADAIGLGVVGLEVWPETRFSPSRRFLNVDYRYNSG